MEQAKKKKQGYLIRLSFGICMIVLLFGSLLYVRYHRSNESSVSQQTETKPIQQEYKKETFPNFPVDQTFQQPESPPVSEPKPDQSISNVENPNVHNMISDPYQNFTNPRIIELRKELIILNDRLNSLSRYYENEKNPAAKAIFKQDLEALQQQITEIQKEMEELGK